MYPRASFECCYAAIHDIDGHVIGHTNMNRQFPTLASWWESYNVMRDVPVGVEIAGCLVEAQGCNQDGCPSGTGTTSLSYPGEIQFHFVNQCCNSAVTEEIRQQ